MEVTCARIMDPEPVPLNSPLHPLTSSSCVVTSNSRRAGSHKNQFISAVVVKGFNDPTPHSPEQAVRGVQG